MSQACKSIADMETLQTTIAGVHNYINGSEVRLALFKDIAVILEQETIKLRRLYDI